LGPPRCLSPMGDFKMHTPVSRRRPLSSFAASPPRAALGFAASRRRCACRRPRPRRRAASSASELISTLGRERIPLPSAIATSMKSRWMSRPIDLISPPCSWLVESRWTNDIDGFGLGAQPGGSQGRPLKSRARSPSRKAACPSCVSPESPSGPTLGRGSDSQLPGSAFMPREAAVLPSRERRRQLRSSPSLLHVQRKRASATDLAIARTVRAGALPSARTRR